MSKLQATRFNSNCAICYENYADGDVLSSPEQCGHVFHKACLENWLKCKHQCPTCRANIVTEQAITTPVVSRPPPPQRPPPPIRPAATVITSAITATARSIPNIYKTLNFSETLTLFNILQSIMKPMASKLELYPLIHNEIIEVLDTVFIVDYGCETAYELLNKIKNADHIGYKHMIYDISDDLYRALQQFIPKDQFIQNEVVRQNYTKVCNMPPLQQFRNKYLD